MSTEVDFGCSPTPFSFFTFSIMNTCYLYKHRNPLISFNNESTLTMCRTYFSASCGPDNCTRLAISCNDSVKKVWNAEAELITGRNYWENKFYSMCIEFYSITEQVLSITIQSDFCCEDDLTDEPSGFSHHFSRVMTSRSAACVWNDMRARLSPQHCLQQQKTGATYRSISRGLVKYGTAQLYKCTTMQL